MIRTAKHPQITNQPSEEVDATAFGDGHSAEKIAEILRNKEVHVR